MQEFVHVWHFQYIWEESVTGVCIVPAQRLPAPGSFITQTPLLSLFCLCWTHPPLPLPPSETLSSHTPISKQLQETVLPTEWSAALIRILFSPPPPFFFSVIYGLLQLYFCLSLEANTLNVVFEHPVWNNEKSIAKMFPYHSILSGGYFLKCSLPDTLPRGNYQ